MHFSYKERFINTKQIWETTIQAKSVIFWSVEFPQVNLLNFSANSINYSVEPVVLNRRYADRYRSA